MSENEKLTGDNKASSEARRLSKMPDAFVILFIVILCAGLLTYVLPAGSFVTHTVEKTVNGQLTQRTLIKPDSFSFSDKRNSNGAALFDTGDQIGLMNYAFEGLVSGNKYGSAVGVVAFILIVGGAFGVVMQTGAINNGILALIDKTKSSQVLIIPLLFTLFSLGGAVFGMGEEAIAFCIVLVPLMIALGYDAITGVLITYVATQIGFATSWMNPFSVAIAQGIADVPLMSGQGFRMILWLVFTLIGLGFTLWYAYRIKLRPETSYSLSSNEYFKDKQKTLKTNYTYIDSLILLVFFAGLAWVIWGVVAHAYYIPEIATQFFCIGLACGFIAMIGKRMSANGLSEAFQQGAKDLLPAALIVGMAKGIVLVLGGDDVTEPSVLNTLLFYASNAIGETSSYVNASAMLIFQATFNFFVASGSGQAAITMPLMAPLSDLVGLNRQIAVLAFQLGDGLSNIIIPTSASLIGCLGVARIDWSIWFKFIWRLFTLLIIAALVTMWIAVAIGLS
uniref:putative basic amino acid antiporter YfcC n=1 Tax=Ningiella ruwaisensis TaxID=2364274 RepID=UPI00109FEBF2|nr:putative basic amino acid antiporter YfcC [Ningiella ruwaisensis]